VTSQVSHPYKSTDFTQALNILISVSFRNDLDSHTLLSLENDPIAFCILALTSLLVLPFSATILHKSLLYSKQKYLIVSKLNLPKKLHIAQAYFILFFSI